jgi:uncharacterized paraquat-inducible protein A
MENIPEKITIQCSNCQAMVIVDVGRLKENDSYVCSNCFSSIPVDASKLLDGLIALMKKAEEFKDKKAKGHS